jgi:cleavage stimulation factor subunit 3
VGADARVTFETVVSRLTQKSEMVAKAKPLYAFFHKYEAQYGELSQISKLEHRMGELFPDDPKLSRFASRFSGDGFDPTAVRLIVSPAAQMRPKNVIMQSIEQQPPSIHESPRPQYIQEASKSPRPQYLQATNSPKRPFPADDFESEANRPRKLARAESPLKGAAGRRLDQQKRLQQSQSTPAWQSSSSFAVPRDITFLLSIIPRAELYHHTKFVPENLVRLLRETIVPDYSTWKTAKDESQAPPQRYDGRRPRSSQTPRQDGGQTYTGQSSGGFQGSYPGPPVVTQSPYGISAGAYGPPPGSTYQPSPPEPSRTGYTEVDEFGRSREPSVQLQPAASWYYHS